MSDDNVKMDCQITKLLITPAHFDKDGEIDRDEYATLTLKIPMDTDTGRKWVAGLLEHLSREFVAVQVYNRQMDLPGVEGKSGSKSVSVTAEDVENQLNAVSGTAELVSKAEAEEV